MSIPGPVPPSPPGTPINITSTPPPVIPPSIQVDTIEEALTLIGPDGEPISFLGQRQEGLSLIEFTTLINLAIQELREELNRANFLDPTVLRNLHLNVITATFVSDLFNLLGLDAGGFKAVVDNKEAINDVTNGVLEAFHDAIAAIVMTNNAEESNINTLYLTFNANIGIYSGLTPAQQQFIFELYSSDGASSNIINNQNSSISTINTALGDLETSLQAISSQDFTQANTLNAQLDTWNNTDLGTLTPAQLQQLIDDTNDAINTYNAYVSTRNTNVQNLFSDISTALATYNGDVAAYNDAVVALNQIRSDFGFMGTYSPLSTIADPPATLGALNTITPINSGSPQQPIGLVVPPTPTGLPIPLESTITELAFDIYTIEDWNLFAANQNSLVEFQKSQIQPVIDLHNGLTDVYNAAIDIVEPIRVSLGLSPPAYPIDQPTIPFPPEDLDPLPILPPITSLTNQNQITVPSPTGNALDFQEIPNPIAYIPGEEQALSDALVDITLQQLGILDLMNTYIDAIRDEIDRQLFLNNFGFDIILPTAYLQKQPDYFLSSTTGGSSYGVGAQAVNLLSSRMERILSRGIFENFAEAAGMPIPPSVFDSIQLATLSLLSQNALLLIPSVARFLGPELANIAYRSPAFSAVLGLFLTNQLIETVSSRSITGIVGRTLQQLARQEKLGSFGQVAELTRQISAGAGFALLGIALSRLGLSLGLPNLSLQLLANADGIATVDLLSAGFAGNSLLRTVLENPISLLFLKASLTEQANFERGFVSGTDAKVVADSIDNVLELGLINNFFQFREELRKQLAGRGATPFEALRLANEALDIVRSELGSNVPDAAVNPNLDRESAIRDAINSQIRQDRENIRQVLRESLDRAIRLGPETLRELRNNLASELRGRGFRRRDANVTGNQIINSIAGFPPFNAADETRLATLREAVGRSAINRTLALGPFASEREFLAVLRGQTTAGAFDTAVAGLNASNVLSRQQLAEDIRRQVINLTAGTFGDDTANRLANSVLHTVFGAISISEVARQEAKDPLSLINQIETQVSRLQESGNERVATSLKELYTDFTNLNADTVHLLNTALRPSEAFIGSLAAAMGSNREIDFFGGV